MIKENIIEKIQEVRADTSKISCYQNSQDEVLEKIQKEISRLKDYIDSLKEDQDRKLGHIIKELKLFDDTQRDLCRAFNDLNGSDWKKYNKIKEILSDNQ